MPKVVGMPVSAARSALLERGFEVRVGARRHADRPAGTVDAVRPAASSAARGALITLIPSSGQRQVVVPAVAGFSQAVAIAKLERRGFIVQRSMAYAPSPAGTVLGTVPAAGTPADPHSSISLAISAGPEPKPTPPGHAKDKPKHKSGKKHKKGEQPG